MVEIIAPHTLPRATTFLHFNGHPSKLATYLSYKNLHPRVQIQFPLHKPNYKPPMKVKPPPTKSDPKPITTTSDILHLMDSLKLSVPLDMYTSLVKECTELHDSEKAIELHEHIRRSGLRFSLPLLNRILLMYVSCGCFSHARQLFDQMARRDFNSWAIVIAGSVENGEYDAAINLFTTMLCEVQFENASDHQLEFSVSGILVSALKSCLHTMDLELGRQLHGWLWKMGYFKNVVLSSFLISFYGKLKCLEDAKSVFEQATNRNTVVWTSRIVNSCNHNKFEETVSVFKEMESEGVRMNAYTFSSVLKACGRLGDIHRGRQIHANVTKLGLESDGFVQCALVDMYGKNGLFKDATRAFEMSGDKRNSACWNAMLVNYAQHGLCREATKILGEMKLAGLDINKSLSSEINLFCGSTILENNVDVCL